MAFEGLTGPGTNMPLGTGKIRLVRAITIKINGIDVGYVSKWTQSEPEVVGGTTHAYEIGRDGPIPNESARGAYGGGTIDMTRFVLWNEELQDAVGYPVDKLTDIMSPFICEEHILKPNGTVAVNVYHGCLFTNEHRLPDITDAQRAVRFEQSTTIMYEYKTRPIR
jgi:hypothetical protein